MLTPTFKLLYSKADCNSWLTCFSETQEGNQWGLCELCNSQRDRKLVDDREAGFVFLLHPAKASPVCEQPRVRVFSVAQEVWRVETPSLSEEECISPGVVFSWISDLEKMLLASLWASYLDMVFFPLLKHFTFLCPSFLKCTTCAIMVLPFISLLWE